jgi:hypothetical protein
MPKRKPMLFVIVKGATIQSASSLKELEWVWRDVHTQRNINVTGTKLCCCSQLGPKSNLPNTAQKGLNP